MCYTFDRDLTDERFTFVRFKIFVLTYLLFVAGICSIEWRLRSVIR